MFKKKKISKTHPCPDCDFEAKSKAGLVSHSKKHAVKEEVIEGEAVKVLGTLSDIEEKPEVPAFKEEFWTDLWQIVTDAHARRAILRAKNEYEGGFFTLKEALERALADPAIKKNGLWGKPLNDKLKEL